MTPAATREAVARLQAFLGMAAFAKYLPLIFAVGFLAPLISQLLTAFGFDVPFGNLWLGLAVAIGWGLIAQFKGRWI